ncbi:group II intron reverse transcriptase/maturase [Halosquirtibacter laminarini]|uniref:Group II intron reverse transcriptase/maturase n=1 Tax=Halosquirtibacter laminarini TaxID=3374600 RepID=A0AC61NR33_9BACT|nr:group II intron reverse transcriptase/maturase [Prolixibacteraceae bacterium]
MGKQVKRVNKQGRALATDLIGIVCSHDNLHRAFKQVKRNKGAAGIDRVPVGKFSTWYAEYGESMVDNILLGTYYPQSVRSVMIPKANGGDRELGIPTVQDRVIQQAISQVLTPIYENEFSNYSYGFRPKRSAHQALKQASEYVSDDMYYVVDMDMKSFFDEVNHDRLIWKLSHKVEDQRLLLLIRRYLQCGIMKGGVTSVRIKGTPQGSPLSPLLSNVVLDELDKELESRGHCFVRYADDFSIFVRSHRASERVKKSISNFLTSQLKLKVNEEKSISCESSKTELLGYTILNNGTLIIGRSRTARLKSKVRMVTKRNRGQSLKQVVEELNPILRGWFNYFKWASCKRILNDIDAWIRRKLRCYRLKQCKKTIAVKRFLNNLGVRTWQSWILALSGKGWWRKSSSPQSHQAMSLQWFDKLGLYNMSINYEKFRVN